MTYHEQAQRFRKRAAHHERAAFNFSEQAQANAHEFPSFARECQLEAGREMRTAIAFYDFAARADERFKLVSNAETHADLVAA